MTTSELMQALSDAGAPFEAILIAVRALEEKDAELAAIAAEKAEKRAKDAERKRIERGAECPRTVQGQGADMSADGPFPAPPNENNLTPPTHTPENTIPRAKANPFPCPIGVDETDWSGLKANRKAKKAALTEGAHRQIVRKLDQWARDGWPPGPIVAAAAERGWTTVFETDEMKAAANGHANRSKSPHNSGQPDRRNGFERACDRAIERTEAERREADRIAGDSQRALAAPRAV